MQGGVAVSGSRSHDPGRLHSASPFFQVFSHVNQAESGARGQATWEQIRAPVSLTPAALRPPASRLHAPSQTPALACDASAA